MWFQKAAVVETPVAVVEPPKVAVPPNIWKPKPELSLDEVSEYAKVASAIGLVTGPILEERLEHCLQVNSIDCYSSRGVWDFLDIKLGEGKWVWAGLRQKDCDELPSSWHTSVHRRKVSFSDTPYNRIIPLPVLLTVQKIATEVPEVNFYVSQSADENADPFLLVTTRTIGLFIVERWDEPDFRER